MLQDSTSQLLVVTSNCPNVRMSTASDPFPSPAASISFPEWRQDPKKGLSVGDASAMRRSVGWGPARCTPFLGSPARRVRGGRPCPRSKRSFRLPLTRPSLWMSRRSTASPHQSHEPCFDRGLPTGTDKTIPRADVQYMGLSLIST